MIEKGNCVLQHEFLTRKHLNFSQSFVHPLEEGHTLESKKGHH
jgi:hypothetical protein